MSSQNFSMRVSQPAQGSSFETVTLLGTLTTQQGLLVIYDSGQSSHSLLSESSVAALQMDCGLPPANAVSTFSNSTVTTARFLGEYTKNCNS